MTRARDLSKIVNNKMTVFKYTATSSQTTFTGADDNSATLSYNPNSIIVTYNGIVLENVSEYTATNGTSIVLTTGATVGSEVNIIAFEDIAYSGVMPTTGGTFTGAVTHNSTVAHTGDVTITGNANDANGNLKVTTNTPTNYPAVVIQTSTGGNGSETHGLHIKNTAAGHGLRVDDESSDNSPFVIASDGKVGIGLNTPLAPLHIEAADNTELMNFTVTGNERWALKGVSGSGSNDMLRLGIAGGTQAMYWNEGGAVQKPAQPSFYAYPSADVTLTLGGAWTTVAFASTGWNTGNHYNTSNYRFTVPVAGKYLVTWSWQLENNNIADWMYFYPRLNGQNSQDRQAGISFSDFRNEAGYHTENGAWIMNLLVNDYIDMVFRGIGGVKSFKAESHWSMMLLG